MRKLLVAALAVGAFLVPPAGADHGILDVQVDPVIYSNGEKAVITGTVLCEAGRFRFDFIGTSGSQYAFFTGQGRCTGEPEPFRVSVRANETGFSSGPAVVYSYVLASERYGPYSDSGEFFNETTMVVR